jgi:hypothetical protein
MNDLASRGHALLYFGAVLLVLGLLFYRDDRESRYELDDRREKPWQRRARQTTNDHNQSRHSTTPAEQQPSPTDPHRANDKNAEPAPPELPRDRGGT